MGGFFLVGQPIRWLIRVKKSQQAALIEHSLIQPEECDQTRFQNEENILPASTLFLLGRWGMETYVHRDHPHEAEIFAFCFCCYLTTTIIYVRFNQDIAKQHNAFGTELSP